MGARAFHTQRATAARHANSDKPSAKSKTKTKKRTKVERVTQKECLLGWIVRTRSFSFSSSAHGPVPSHHRHHTFGSAANGSLWAWGARGRSTFKERRSDQKPKEIQFLYSFVLFVLCCAGARTHTNNHTIAGVVCACSRQVPSFKSSVTPFSFFLLHLRLLAFFCMILLSIHAFSCR